MSWELTNHLRLDGFHSDATAIPAAETDKESGKSAEMVILLVWGKRENKSV